MKNVAWFRGYMPIEAIESESRIDFLTDSELDVELMPKARIKSLKEESGSCVDSKSYEEEKVSKVTQI